MNFRLPYSWLKEHVSVPKDARELASQLSLHGASIETVHHTRQEFTNVVVGEIFEIKPHPNADKLQIAIVDVGKGKREIVCGAPNIKVGQKVPVALTGATLLGDLKIIRREVRGIVSEGMLCSAKELGVHDDHVGILILHPKEKVGVELKSLGEEEDFILEVEPTTNRPDLASIRGIAREVSAITSKPLKSEEPSALSLKGSEAVRVVVKDKPGCPRFTAVYMENIKNGASPWWMQERLARAGIRPINAIVDIANYIMLEYGQPMHAFDADKIKSGLTVRRAKKGEKLLALDGKTYEFTPDHLIIADESTPISIAGIMGGESTGVTEETENVIFEAANWDPLLIRKTSRELQLFSDASRLFEKGLSVYAPPLALARAVNLATEIVGGKAKGRSVDISRPYHKPSIKFAVSELKRILGVSIPLKTVKELLQKLGFTVLESGSVLTVLVPYWRDNDVRESIDLVEEVARLYGYYRFESKLPEPTFARSGIIFSEEHKVRHHLKGMGFTEVYNYSLIPKPWLEAFGFPLTKALKVQNPLSADYEYMRPSLLPSLVKTIERNEAERSKIAVFEIGNVYTSGGSGKGVDRYRTEVLRLSAMITNQGSEPEELYRQVKGVVEMLLELHGYTDITWTNSEKEPTFAKGLVSTMYAGDELVGTMGILNPNFTRALGVSQTIAAFDVPMLPLTQTRTVPRYREVPRYPAVKRDISLVLNTVVGYTELVRVMQKSTPILRDVELFDVYSGAQLGEGKQSYAMHLTYRLAGRTLSAEEVEDAEREMLRILKKKFGINLR